MVFDVCIDASSRMFGVDFKIEDKIKTVSDPFQIDAERLKPIETIGVHGLELGSSRMIEIFNHKYLMKFLTPIRYWQ